MYFEKKQQKVICSFATDLLKEWAQANLTEEVSESKENCLLSNRKRVSEDNSDYYMLYLGPVFLNFFFSNNGNEGGYVRIIQGLTISGTTQMFEHGYQLNSMAIISTKIFSLIQISNILITNIFADNMKPNLWAKTKHRMSSTLHFQHNGLSI